MNKKTFEKRRKEEIEKLLSVSTPEEQKRIEKARCEGRKLRRELEDLEKEL